jgi:dienelactone hydrolase
MPESRPTPATAVILVSRLSTLMALPAGRRGVRTLAIAGLSAALLLHLSVRAQPSGGTDAPSQLPEAARTSDPALAANDESAITPVDLDWVDTARSRPVPVRLYLPASASAARPVPLVVFSHGIGGSRRGYSYLGRYWASQGYASLHLQHVGSDRTLWSGNIFGLVGRLQGAAQDEEAMARVADLRFALDQVLAHADFAPKLDAARIVAAGHSYGANTTLLAIGAKPERNGRLVDLADPRLKAGIILSAPPFYGEGNTAKILAGIKVPTLHITATEDVIRIPGYYSGAEDRVAVYEATPGPRKFLAVFEGGSHSMFTDRAGTGGVALNPQVKTATRELGLAFMNSVFGREAEALATWPRRFAAILARFSAAAP